PTSRLDCISSGRGWSSKEKRKWREQKEEFPGGAQGLGECRGRNALSERRIETALAIERDTRHGLAPFLSVKVLSVKAGRTKDGLGLRGSWLRRCVRGSGVGETASETRS